MRVLFVEMVDLITMIHFKENEIGVSEVSKGLFVDKGGAAEGSHTKPTVCKRHINLRKSTGLKIEPVGLKKKNGRTFLEFIKTLNGL